MRRSRLRSFTTTIAASTLATAGALAVLPASPAYALAPSALNPCEQPTNGDYTATTGSTAVVDTTTLTWGGTAFTGVDVGGVAVFTFDTMTVQSGATLLAQGTRPLALLARNSIVVNSGGLIAASAGSAGGGAGGPVGSSGSGPGGGGVGTGSGGGGGGGFGGIGGNGADPVDIGAGPGGPAYGDLASNIQGGSGGGGSAVEGGGHGGGAIVLVANQSVTVNGIVDADGNIGGDVSASGAGAGGGSGGAIVVRAPVIGGGGGVSAVGGNGSAGSLGPTTGGGGGGAGGRILLTTNSGSFALADVLPGSGGLPGGGAGAVGVVTSQAYGPAPGPCEPAPWPLAPTGPFNVTATSGPASKQITLGWTPANPNGSAIINYTGQCVAAAANPGLPTKTATTGPGKTSLLMGGLVAGKRYSCTVQATNAVGSGPKVVTTPLVVTAKA